MIPQGKPGALRGFLGPPQRVWRPLTFSIRASVFLVRHVQTIGRVAGGSSMVSQPPGSLAGDGGRGAAGREFQLAAAE